MIDTWTRLDEAKRQWLWSTNADYWNWLEHVLRAYCESGRLAEADAFGARFLNDPATPPEGFAILGASCADVKWRQRDFAALFSLCEKVAQAAPSYEWTAEAYSWLALRAWKRGNAAQARDYAQKTLSALGVNCQLYWKEAYQARAHCLLAGLDLSQVSPQCPLPRAVLEAQLAQIQETLGTLPNGV